MLKKSVFLSVVLIAPCVFADDAPEVKALKKRHAARCNAGNRQNRSVQPLAR